MSDSFSFKISLLLHLTAKRESKTENYHHKKEFSSFLDASSNIYISCSERKWRTSLNHLEARKRVHENAFHFTFSLINTTKFAFNSADKP